MSIEDALHAEYVGFFHRAERERRWSVFEDIPWERQPRPSAADAEPFVEGLMLVKSALVRALGTGPLIVDGSIAIDDFRAAWRFEESRHKLALSDWLRRGSYGAGRAPVSVRTSGSPAWATAAVTGRQRAALGYLCELLSFAACSSRAGRRLGQLDPCLGRILDFVARDDIAHARYFEAALRLLAQTDAAGVAADLTATSTAISAASPLFEPRELEERVLGPALARLGVAATEPGAPGPKKARDPEPALAAGSRP